MAGEAAQIDLELSPGYRAVVSILDAALNSEDDRGFVYAAIHTLVDVGLARGGWLYLSEGHKNGFSLFAGYQGGFNPERSVKRSQGFMHRLRTSKSPWSQLSIDEDGLTERDELADDPLAASYLIVPFHVAGVLRGYFQMAADPSNISNPTSREIIQSLIDLMAAGYAVLKVSRNRSRTAGSLRNRVVSFSAGFEAAPIPHLLTDGSFTVIDANLAMLELIGRSRSQIVGSSLHVLYEELEWDRFKEFVENIVKPTTSIASSKFGAVRMKLAKGSTTLLEHILVPVFGAGGALANLSVTAIPQRFEPDSPDNPGETGLLEQLLGSAPLVIFAADLDGRLRLAEGGLRNRRRSEGREQIIGPDIFRFGEPKIPRAFILNSLLYSGRIEVTFQDGDEYLMASMAVVEDPDTKIPQAIGMVLDVTEHVKVVDRLEQERTRSQTIEDLYRSAMMIDNLEHWLEHVYGWFRGFMPTIGMEYHSLPDLEVEFGISDWRARSDEPAEIAVGGIVDGRLEGVEYLIFSLERPVGRLVLSKDSPFEDSELFLASSVANVTGTLVSRIEGDRRHRLAISVNPVSGLQYVSEAPSVLSRFLDDGIDSAECFVLRCHSMRDVMSVMGSETPSILRSRLTSTITAAFGDTFDLFESDLSDLVLFKGVTDTQAAVDFGLLSQLARLVKQTFTINGINFVPDFTIGFVAARIGPVQGESTDSQIQLMVVQAMAAAEFAHRNQLPFSAYGTTISEKHTSLLVESGAALNQMIDNSELTLTYYPLYSMSGERHVEGRMPMIEVAGRIMKDLEIRNVAASTAQTVKLEKYLLALALRDSGNLTMKPTDLAVRMRISSDTICGYGFVDWLTSELSRNNLDPSKIVLELSERELELDDHKLHAALEALGSVSVRVSLTEFGSGVASLRNLETFDVWGISVATGISRVMDVKGYETYLIRSIIELAQLTGLDITATEVESLDQVKELGELGFTRFSTVGSEGRVGLELVDLVESPMAFALPHLLSTE